MSTHQDLIEDLSDDEAVEVRRNAGLAAVVAVASSALAIAYLARAIGSGGALDWLLGLLLSGLGVSQLHSLVDARTPLLIADGFGIRLRLGRQWRGLPWSALEQVVVEPRTSLLHDGRLVVAPRHLNRALEGLDAAARRQVAFNQRLYGAPLVVPLGLTTRVSSDDLVTDLAELADGRAAVVELAGYVAEPVIPETPALHARREEIRHRDHPGGSVSGELVPAPDQRGLRELGGLGAGWGTQMMGSLVSRLGGGRTHDIDAGDPVLQPVLQTVLRPVSQPSPAPTFSPAQPLREARPASRIDVSIDRTLTIGNTALRLDPGETVHADAGLPELRELHRPEDDWSGLGVAPLVIDDFATEPAIVAVIGPRIAAAWTGLGFDVESLSTRTRIRPHVIEAIEVDDFEPCGGDFYARGHLRCLARVLGLPGEELVAEFDARYASAPINARRVFEAELATGMPGGFRTSFAGPRWSLMIGVVLVLVLAWGTARLFTGEPATQTSPAPSLDGSAGLASDRAPITSSLGKPVKMTVKASRAAADVQVREHGGRILFSGHLAAGRHKQLFGTGPFTVRASDPAAVDVWVAGKARGPVGGGDQSGRRTVR